MKVWLVFFFVFFGAIELYQWLQGLTVPFPVFVVAGALLAAASNTDKWPRLPWSTQPATWLSSATATTPSLEKKVEAVTPPAVSPTRYYPGPQLPNLDPQATKPVSFTIRKPTKKRTQTTDNKPEFETDLELRSEDRA
jgi:hypothetical protein